MSSLRAATTSAAGAAVLVISIVLPWITIPGGAFERAVMNLRGESIPATGAAPSALPLTSAVVALLVLLGLVLALLAARDHGARVPVAAVTVVFALLVLAVMIDRLFVERV